MSVTRYGTYPVFRYEVKNEGWRSSIFIDDINGNLVIEFDSRKFFGHWWSTKDGLRKFLASTNIGYINDKLSYGLDTWDGQKAYDELYKLCEEKHGHIDEWPYELYEAVEAIETHWPSSTFYTYVMCNECFNGLFEPGDHSFGEIGANLYVVRFTEKIWPTFITHLEKELENEGGQDKRTIHDMLV